MTRDLQDMHGPWAHNLHAHTFSVLSSHALCVTLVSPDAEMVLIPTTLSALRNEHFTSSGELYVSTFAMNLEFMEA